MTDNTSKSFFPITWLIGLCGLLVAFGATGVLVLSALGLSETLPGCGPDSGCAQLTSSVWSALPLINWPVSFIGFAYFSGLIVAWIWSRPSPSLLWLMRCGIIISVGFVIVMAMEQAICRWCLAAHIGNLIAWVAAEMCARSSLPQKPKSIIPGVVGFVVITITLAVVLPIRQKAIAENAAAQLAANQTAITEETPSESTRALLDARHVLGDSNAPVQVVMFTDYQCPDCRRIEAQMSQILKQRDDVSLAIKHFPFCAACNEHTNGRTIHANACWAARAAETAHILGGIEGFESMHEWLFEEKGRFTDSTFPDALRALGFDPSTFIATMTSNETLEAVRGDTDAAIELGIFFTPMIFINGVEYTWYYGGDNSLAETIDLVAQSRQPVKAPLDARERLFEDWRIGRIRRQPGIANVSWAGDGPVEVVVFGDYQSDPSRQLDQLIRDQLKTRDEIQYAWRHYPLEMTSKASTKLEGSEAMARIVEAARSLQGEDARWSMHAWLMETTPPSDEEILVREAAQRLGVTDEVLRSEMKNSAISARLARDLTDKQAIWSKHLPVIVVNDRLVPRWSTESMPADELITRIIDAAHEEKRLNE